MSIEALGSDDDFSSRLADYFVERNWNGHTIDLKGSNVSHLFRAFPMNGRFEMKQQIRPMKVSVGGSAEGSTNTDGESSVGGEVHVTAKDDDGGSISVSAGGSVRSDGDGNVSGEGKIEVSFEKDF